MILAISPMNSLAQLPDEVNSDQADKTADYRENQNNINSPDHCRDIAGFPPGWSMDFASGETRGGIGMALRFAAGFYKVAWMD